MRDRVTLKLGGGDYPLLPAFSVADAFEDRHGSLAAHLGRLMDLSATLNQRSFLIMEAMKAARAEDGGPSAFTIEATKKSIFDAGMWSDEIVLTEIELVERLLYTPEQYMAKKSQREEATKAAMEAMGHLDGFPPSSDLPSPE